jgi:hypothetical protein
VKSSRLKPSKVLKNPKIPLLEKKSEGEKKNKDGSKLGRASSKNNFKYHKNHRR